MRATILKAAVAIVCVAAAARPEQRAHWMQEGKWGVMSHFLADWKAKENGLTMTPAEWNKLIDGFDVDRLASDLAKAGASWYQISIGQNSGYYLAPNATYDKLVGGASKCSRRDLVSDLYAALHKRNIRLMVYLPSGAPDLDNGAMPALEWKKGAFRNREFQTKWEAVIRDWAGRWGDKISGWWFDGVYYPNSMYRTSEAPNFQSFAAAARAGNRNAVLAFNPGVYNRIHSIAPEEDFTAGEINDPEAVQIRRTSDGLIDGTQIQMLSFLGTQWGSGSPRFSTEQVVAYSKKLWDSHGAVTWDVPVDLQGHIADSFLKQLAALGDAAKQWRSGK